MTFLCNFYGKQNLKFINKLISSLFMKLTTINFCVHRSLSVYFFISAIFSFKQIKKATYIAEQQNKIKQEKNILPEQLFLSKRGLNKFWLQLTAVLWWFECF